MKVATWLGAAGALCLLLAFSGPTLAAQKLVLASGERNALSHRAGVGLSSLIKFELLPATNIDLQTMATAGAVDNAQRLKAGEADLAIFPSAVGHMARLGIGSFAGHPPETGFRAIATLWRDALHLVMREDDVATGTVDDVLKLKDRRVFLGEAATGMADANHLLLADLGLNADEVFELATVADGDGISAIKRGDVDMFSTAVRPPQALLEGVFDAAASGDEAASGLRLLGVTEDQMARANGNHWLWTPYVIPAATYPGQTDDVGTIALSNILVVRADVDADVVYAITKSIFENLDYLKRVDAVMADLALETALDGLAMPLHPGALRYYDEAGRIPKPVSPKPVSEDGTAPAQGVPGELEGDRPAVAPERYPGSDFAGEWPAGLGGPLLKTLPPDPGAKPDTEPSAGGAKPEDALHKPRPHWRQRAVL